MKKILIIILLSTLGAFAQSSTMLLLFGDDFEPETQLYLSSLTTPLSYDQQVRLNTFVKMVKDSLQISSLSSKFDVMYLFANETSEAGLKNLVKRSHDATAVNSPTFTQWEGFAGNGTSSYINTNYTDSIDATARTRLSSSMSVYIRNFGVATNQGHIGGYRTDYINTATWLFLTGSTLYYDNVGNGVNISYNNAETRTLRGLWITSRTSGTTATLYANGIQKAQSTSHIAAERLTNIKNGIMARYYGNTDAFSNLSDSQYSFAFIGAGLTATEVSKLTNCIEWYMDSVNRGVIP